MQMTYMHCARQLYTVPLPAPTVEVKFRQFREEIKHWRVFEFFRFRAVFRDIFPDTMFDI